MTHHKGSIMTFKKSMLLLPLCLVGFAVQAENTPAPTQVYGWIEQGMLSPGNLPMQVKMDTGAETSSLDARDITPFDRDGDPWVRFTVESRDPGKTQSQTYERKVQRQVTIRGAGGVDHRPEVLMELCVGSEMHAELFTLRDRSKMDYPVLIGRRTIAHLGLVDVNRTFVTTLNCPTR
jgi:hypothetical protein